MLIGGRCAEQVSETMEYVHGNVAREIGNEVGSRASATPEKRHQTEQDCGRLGVTAGD